MVSGSKGNPANLRGCPAAVIESDLHDSALALTIEDREAVNSRNPTHVGALVSPKTCQHLGAGEIRVLFDLGVSRETGRSGLALRAHSVPIRFRLRLSVARGGEVGPTHVFAVPRAVRHRSPRHGGTSC
jgi:hypothetical protein